MELIVKILRALAPASWLTWLNGYKSVIGAFGVAIVVILRYFGIETPPFVLELASALLGVGIIHKLEKTQAAADELKKDIEQLRDRLLED